MAADPLEARFPVEIGGEFRSAALRGHGVLELRADGAALLPERETPGVPARFELPLGRLLGVACSGSTLTLTLDEGAIVLRGEPRLGAAARDLVARACDPGELTLALRALGSHRAGANALQRRFFEPLLAARRKLAKAGDPRAQAVALDGRMLGAAYGALTRELAAEYGPASAADRRALESQIEQQLAPLAIATAALTDSAKELAIAPDERAIAAWREWAAAARRVFSAADRCWPPVAALLRGWRPTPRQPLWRRLFGRRR